MFQLANFKHADQTKFTRRISHVSRLSLAPFKMLWGRLGSFGLRGNCRDEKPSVEQQAEKIMKRFLALFLTKHATAVPHRVRQQEPLVKNEEYFTMSLEPRLIISTNTLKLHDLDLHTTREGGRATSASRPASDSSFKSRNTDMENTATHDYSETKPHTVRFDKLKPK